MSEKRRFPWKTIFFLALFAAGALYFGGGLWGPGGGRFRERLDEIVKRAQETPATLRQKIDDLQALASQSAEEAGEDAKREARERAEKLAKVMEAWAEDRYLATKDKVDALLAQGKVAEARKELESVPKEYWSTKFGPEFEKLQEKLR